MRYVTISFRRIQDLPTIITRRVPRWVLSLTLFIAALLAGCAPQAKSSSPPAPPPAKVTFVEVQLEDVAVYSDYAAQTYARDMVDVRGRVDGYLEKRLFQVGSDVNEGQVLYQLDNRTYQAEVARARGDLAQATANLEFARRQVALAQAEADLAQADANLMKAKQDVERLRPLVKEDAASQQDLDNATAALQANQANVNARRANVEQTKLSTRAQIETNEALAESRKAALRSAELNLEYATIRAPVAGRIGDTLVQVGGLVNHSSAQPLTTIVPLDPIWVRFKVSEAEHLNFQSRADKDEARLRPLHIILANGAEHPHAGKIQNTTNQVDSKTGTLEIQATFPNPERRILPGQFGRVRLNINDKKNVVLVPQRAVQELQGMQSVLTVGSENKVVARSVVMGDRVGDRWIVLQGLQAGDRVIVDGLQKARPGLPVTPQQAEVKKREPARPSKAMGAE
ncbi:MAG: efflux RND transporter periplasmic adaptor subunit [Acidobacteria bacterium]|nr:efflux RND transporter periplasmic adaptor subunit [Acidobacteriota bacterium]